MTPKKECNLTKLNVLLLWNAFSHPECTFISTALYLIKWPHMGQCDTEFHANFRGHIWTTRCLSVIDTDNTVVSSHCVAVSVISGYLNLMHLVAKERGTSGRAEYTTWACSARSVGPGWRPCSDTAPQVSSSVSGDHSRAWIKIENTNAFTNIPFPYFHIFLWSCKSRWHEKEGLILTVKCWIISGLLFDFSSTSVRTSSTSAHHGWHQTWGRVVRTRRQDVKAQQGREMETENSWVYIHFICIDLVGIPENVPWHVFYQSKNGQSINQMRGCEHIWNKNTNFYRNTLTFH